MAALVRRKNRWFRKTRLEESSSSDGIKAETLDRGKGRLYQAIEDSGFDEDKAFLPNGPSRRLPERLHRSCNVKLYFSHHSLTASLSLKPRS